VSVGFPKVALVLDPEYGDKLYGLAAEMPVWIIGSPPNVAVARHIWKQKPQPEHVVTTFDPDTFEGLMDSIELHHGHHSQTPPFQALEVIGLTLTAEIEQVLGDAGFTPAAASGRDFIATRTRNAEASHEESF
jgi:hypothetical protein